eukprot:UN21565
MSTKVRVFQRTNSRAHTTHTQTKWCMENCTK